MLSTALEQVRCRMDRQFLGFQFFIRGHEIISARVPVGISTSRYRVRIADGHEDFQKVMRLRYDVFVRETQKKENIIRVDLDRYDFMADHLIVEDIRSDQIVGCYRLISSKFSKEFYSQSEFEISDFLKMDGVKLELGRACIHRDHRRGIVIGLLWRGILEYAKRVNARYLFGCASFWSDDVQAAKDLLRIFKDTGHLSTQLQVTPTAKYQHPAWKVELCSRSTDQSRAEIPSLLRSYLKAGAQICGEPAYDRAFSCFDYFVLMNLSNLEASFEEKFS